MKKLLLIFNFFASFSITSNAFASCNVEGLVEYVGVNGSVLMVQIDGTVCIVAGNTPADIAPVATVLSNAVASDKTGSILIHANGDIEAMIANR